MDEGSRILPMLLLPRLLLLTGLSCWLLELPLSVVLVLVVVVVVVVVVAAPRFRCRRLVFRLVVARDAVVVVILIFVIIIVLNLMVGVAGGDVVAGTSSAMHHAVDSDVSWVSCITCRR